MVRSIKKVYIIALAVMVTAATSLAPLTSVFAATEGDLSSTSKLQVYNSSFKDGLGNYLALYGPAVSPTGDAYAYGIKAGEEQESYIVKMNAAGAFVKEFKLRPGYSMAIPNIAIDRYGSTYFPVDKYVDLGGGNSRVDSVILKYNPDDTFNGVIEAFNDTYPGGFRSIYSIAFDGNNSLYMTVGTSDALGTILVKLTQSGGIEETVERLQGDTDGYDAPFLVAIDSHDQLHVAAMDHDRNDQMMRLFAVSHEGVVIKVIGGETPMKLGYGMSVDNNNNLYATSTDFSGQTPPYEGCPAYFEVRKYNSVGAFLGTIDMSPEASEGLVCTIYGGGTTPVTGTRATATPGVTKDGDVFIGTGDYASGQPGKARIAVYSMPKNVATFPPKSEGEELSAKLQLPETANLQYAEIKTQAELGASLQPGYSYPLGLANFKVKVQDGATLPTELTFVTNLKPDQVTAMKYQKGSYSPVPGAVITQTEIDNKPALKVSYTLIDGGELDEDGQVNGEIIDPIGLAVKDGSSGQQVLAPNTGVGSQSVNNLVLFMSIAIVAGAGFAVRQVYRR
ncbi:MAG: hypothetical protein UW38_C0001G0381 [Candidatus Saccharibacteria bacterium GW2011_GWC2_44_17]|nr:MAG: hypothetical protein UW38_C0001G0381 [Candidatus Saccharibacteria bacterium GW2011_GWC2_44_17]OGL33369.1 MAG: hypothetical protein A3E20_00405 [Candidatus Saccharibacteria bacterium RIFCSPHIGHO2_12_FULL_47_16]